MITSSLDGSWLVTNSLTAKLLLALVITLILDFESQGTHKHILPSNGSGSQSQSYFTTDGLPPISSPWCLDPWGSRQMIFLQLNLCGHSPYVTSSLIRGWVYLLLIGFAFVKCTYRTYSLLLKFLHLHYIQVLRQWRLWEAVHTYLTYLMLQRQTSHLRGCKLDRCQIKASYIFYILLRLALCSELFILMNLYDFCLLPAQLCYIFVYTQKVKSRVQIVDQCTLWKVFNGA
jgi:hypothetical protein